MRDLMTENPDLGQKLVAEVERGNELDERGESEKARQIYLAAWERLPSPKNEWELFSQWIADCMFNNCMKTAEYGDAKDWAVRSYSSRPSEIETSCFIQLGMVECELKNTDAALEWFSKAYEIGEKRAFEEFPKKYLAFYLKNRRA